MLGRGWWQDWYEGDADRFGDRCGAGRCGDEGHRALGAPTGHVQRGRDQCEQVVGTQCDGGVEDSDGGDVHVDGVGGCAGEAITVRVQAHLDVLVGCGMCDGAFRGEKAGPGGDDGRVVFAVDEAFEVLVRADRDEDIGGGG